MSTQVDSKPSTVLIESYNERISKFLLPESVHNATVVIGETDSNGVAIATITIPGEKTITTKVKRSNLESTVPLTNVDELDGGKFMCLVMEDRVAIESAASDIMSAMGLNNSEDVGVLTTEQATELELNVMFSAALWVNHGIFVPPFDFTWINTTDEYTEQLANNDNIQTVFEVEAKPNSLAFVGGVKGVALARAITAPSEPETTEVEWSIVEFEITSPEDMGRLTDPDSYVVSTKTGLITTDKPQLNLETLSGWLSVANYTLEEGETVRIKIPSSAIGDVFRMPSLVDSGITGVTEPKDIYYPFKELAAPSDSISPYSLVWEVKDGYYIVSLEGELIDSPGRYVTYAYKYLPSEGEIHYVDYTYREGIVTININGVHTQNYMTDTPIIMIPLITGEAALELGGVESFTSEYITNVDDVITRPTWAVRETDQEQPLESLSTTKFSIDYTDDQKPDAFVILMDIGSGNQWSLRDSSGDEIYGHTNILPTQRTPVDSNLNRYDYNTFEIDITDVLVKGELYTLHANATSLSAIVSPTDTENTHLLITALPEGITKLLFNVGYSKLTVPHLPTTLTNLSGMFKNAYIFNQNISDWDVSHVTNMSSMFENAYKFNSDISNWNVSSVTDMGNMFYSATSFNSDISNWDVSNVTDMGNVFNKAISFNSDISSWDVSSVTNMTAMFDTARAFNQDLSQWCVTNITSRPIRFDDDSKLTAEQLPIWGACPVRLADPIQSSNIGLDADYTGTGWYKATDTGTVYNKDVAESETCVFDGDDTVYVSVYTTDALRKYASRAATSNITDMTSVFNSQHYYIAETFDEDISHWDTSNVTSMELMFNDAYAFNRDIGNWNVSSVTNMASMFINTRFDQDISSWDVSSVTDMAKMFLNASSFDQDLSGWCVTNITEEPTYFSTNASSWTLPKPVWGTCPRGEDGSSPPDEVPPEIEPVDPPIEEPTEFNLSMMSNVDEPGVWELDCTHIPVNSIGEYKEAMSHRVITSAFPTLISSDDYTPDTLIRIQPETLALSADGGGNNFYIVPYANTSGFNFTGEMLVRVVTDPTNDGFVEGALDLAKLTNIGEMGVFEFKHRDHDNLTPDLYVSFIKGEMIEHISNNYEDSIGMTEIDDLDAIFTVTDVTASHSFAPEVVAFSVTSTVPLGDLVMTGELLFKLIPETTVGMPKGILSNMSEVSEFEGRSYIVPDPYNDIRSYPLDARHGVPTSRIADYYYTYAGYDVDESNSYYAYQGGDVIKYIRGDSIFFVRANKPGVKSRVYDIQSEIILTRIDTNPEALDITTVTNCGEPGVLKVPMSLTGVYETDRTVYDDIAENVMRAVLAPYLFDAKYEGLVPDLGHYGRIPKTAFVRSGQPTDMMTGTLRIEPIEPDSTKVYLGGLPYEDGYLSSTLIDGELDIDTLYSEIIAKVLETTGVVIEAADLTNTVIADENMAVVYGADSNITGPTYGMLMVMLVPGT